METSQLDIYEKLAVIAIVPISIIGLYIAYRSWKSQIKNSETKTTKISQQNQYKSEGNQYFFDVKIYNFVKGRNQIQKDYEDS